MLENTTDPFAGLDTHDKFRQVFERETRSRWGNRGPERRRLDGLEHELRSLGEQLAVECDLERRP